MTAGTTERNRADAAATAAGDQEVFITRVFDAPRERVFEAWADPDRLGRWFAPRGCTVWFRRFEFRPGGGFHSCIRNPAVHDCWCVGVYRDIVAPERIVLALAVSDEKGELVDPTAVGMDPDWPRETVVTVTFADLDGKTQLTLRQTVSESLAKRTGAYPSWLDMFDRLAERLAD